MAAPLNVLGFIRLDYLSLPALAAMFLALGAFIVATGSFSLTGMSPLRRWVAISIRLVVLLLFLLLIAGAQWERQNKNLEVMVVRDISLSTENVRDFPGKTLQSSLDHWMMSASRDTRKLPGDLTGTISFNERPLIDVMFTDSLDLDGRSIRDRGTGTDVSAAMNLALASFGNDTMRRIVLAWDGTSTTGDLDAALSAAASAHVPVDVFPLNFDVPNVVLIDRFIAPTWKREKDPFTVDVILRNTSKAPQTGTVTITRNSEKLEERHVTLKPGPNVQHVRVPALNEPGLHRFKATFNADGPAGAVDSRSAEALRVAEAFTFVKGRGNILFVDGTENNAGQVLANALASEGIEIRQADHIRPENFPNSLVDLQGYDVVILANVARGSEGLSEDQQAILASYVQDSGGGLVMIGGPNSFGAGGWEGSKLEQVLPVNMDVPAQRQIPKGALVLVMDPCEIPEGTYWGIQCGIQAISALSSQDEIGIISWSWGGNYQWDFPLQKKGDGEAAIAALKKMQPGDMPEFDAPLRLALSGPHGHDGLLDSDAQAKHIIIISDGDPQGVSDSTYKAFEGTKISVSTVEAYAHDTNDPNVTPIMAEIPAHLHGRAYGPINNNPNALPRIFIKEATLVRRTLVQEDARGIPLSIVDLSSDLVKGLAEAPPVYGMVLTSRKQDPRIELPIVAGKMHDPLLAQWQIGLGRAAAFTSDANAQWAANWVGSADFGKFWAQVVRAVSRPPMDSSLDVQTTVSGDKGHVNVTSLGQDSSFQNFQTIEGTLLPPDLKPRPVSLVQTAPGEYTADFNAKDPGEYVVVLNSRGKSGRGGMMLGGVSVNASEELRDLHSNPAALAHVASVTGGRMLSPFDPDADLFTRDGLAPRRSVMPIWDILVPLAIAMLLLDVAVRRLAWDRQSLRYAAAGAAAFVRSFTETRKTSGEPVVSALRRAKESASDRTRPDLSASQAAPNPKAKFEATGVAGDITQLVGGAVNKPAKPTAAPPPAVAEKKEVVDSIAGLQEAKRRARRRIEGGNE